MAKGVVREEFRSTRNLPEAVRKDNYYRVQDCNDEGKCTESLRGEGRGRWLEWPIWDLSRHYHTECNRWFPSACDLTNMLLQKGVPIVQMKITEVYPPVTNIPRHSSATQGRLRLVCPLDVSKGSTSRLIFPGHTEISYGSEDEGRCIWFDESFEHELRYTGTGPRASLIIDVPHPALRDFSSTALLELEAPDMPKNWHLLHRSRGCAF